MIKLVQQTMSGTLDERGSPRLEKLLDTWIKKGFALSLRRK